MHVPVQAAYDIAWSGGIRRLGAQGPVDSIKLNINRRKSVQHLVQDGLGSVRQIICTRGFLETVEAQAVLAALIF